MAKPVLKVPGSARTLAERIAALEERWIKEDLARAALAKAKDGSSPSMDEFHSSIPSHLQEVNDDEA